MRELPSLPCTPVRIAQSLGLHLRHGNSNNGLDARMWWSVYVLDKQMCFASGRPTAIQDAECTVVADDVYDASGATSTFDMRPFMAYITLHQQISKITSDLFARSMDQAYEKTTIRKIAACDARLVTWCNSLPLDIRPNGEVPSPGPNFGFAANLHILFYQS